MKQGFLVSILFVLGLAACQPIRPEATMAQQPTSQSAAETQIANAMSAAPLAVAKDATILDWPSEEGGDMVVLREGTNGWTCITDWPASPGNDPSCNDAMWMVWNDAYAAGEIPEITQPGIGYMLAGGSDPSATDPYLMEPPAGEEWVSTAPHLMLLVPGGFDAADYTGDHHSGEPYIMWDNTPYEHLMVPVARDAFQEEDPRIENAMSAAPFAIAKDATILDWPAEEGGDMVVLREGTNGWTCITDWPASPGNDPSCNDPVWMAWNDAYAAGEIPEITRPGIGYMLMGGSDPSATDPYLMEPPAGEEWVSTAPHLMLLMPGGFDAAVFTGDHHSGEPYIMWDGTPYEHLMAPVQDAASQ